jgi:structural maintenance of chromosome 4
MLAAVQAFVPPKGSQRLFDLVRLKERKFAPAFFYALQNTLIVADIDVARQIALHSSDNKRYRVVTMDGNLIETSGTISGGGKPSQRAGMRRFNQEKFDEIQANLAQVDGQIRDAKREVHEIADELHKRRPEQLQTQQDKHQLDLQGLRDKILVLESQIEELRIRLQSKDDEPRLQELQELIRENSPEFDSKMSGIQETQELIRKLERQIEDSLTGDMKAQKAVVRELESNCDRLKKSISRNTGKINALLQTGERFAQSLEDSEKYVSDSLSERSSVWPQLEEVRELKQKAKSFADELRSNVKEHESQTEGLNDEIELTNGTIQTILLSVAEFEQKLSKLDSGLRTAKQQIERLSKKIESCDSLDSVPTFSDVKEYDREIAVIDHELTQMQPNLTAIEEWNRRDTQYQHYLAEVERLTKARDQTQSHGEELKVTRCQTFLKGLLTIGEKVKETYQLLTLGGDAELDCVNRQDPFAEGLDFTVRPPGKSWKHISNLSGGEKTLSSLALVFALHSFKETPLYIMDEIDAALDFRNVSIIAHYLRSRTTNAQVIVISLRNNLFELANKLVGIIKVNDCTTSLTISPSTFGNPDSNDPIQNVDRFPLD